MTDLGRWLAENNHRRRVDGEWDCCAFPAEWAIECGYDDPMAKWRRTYASETEALEMIEDAGGLVCLFDEGLFGVNIGRRYGEPHIGDIGVIRIGEHEAGAIYTGRRWAFVAERGLFYSSIDKDAVIAVWAV